MGWRENDQAIYGVSFETEDGERVDPRDVGVDRTYLQDLTAYQLMQGKYRALKTFYEGG